MKEHHLTTAADYKLWLNENPKASRKRRVETFNIIADANFNQKKKKVKVKKKKVPRRLVKRV